MTSAEIKERLLFCDIPYHEEIEVAYRDDKNHKYIALRYDKRKLHEWGKELSEFNIINDFRFLLREKESEKE